MNVNFKEMCLVEDLNPEKLNNHYNLNAIKTKEISEPQIKLPVEIYDEFDQFIGKDMMKRYELSSYLIYDNLVKGNKVYFYDDTLTPENRDIMEETYQFDHDMKRYYENLYNKENYMDEPNDEYRKQNQDEEDDEDDEEDDDYLFTYEDDDDYNDDYDDENLEYVPSYEKFRLDRLPEDVSYSLAVANTLKTMKKYRPSFRSHISTGDNDLLWDTDAVIEYSTDITNDLEAPKGAEGCFYEVWDESKYSDITNFWDIEIFQNSDLLLNKILNFFKMNEKNSEDYKLNNRMSLFLRRKSYREDIRLMVTRIGDTINFFKRTSYRYLINGSLKYNIEDLTRQNNLNLIPLDYGKLDRLKLKDTYSTIVYENLQLNRAQEMFNSILRDKNFSIQNIKASYLNFNLFIDKRIKESRIYLKDEGEYEYDIYDSNSLMMEEEAKNKIEENLRNSLGKFCSEDYIESTLKAALTKEKDSENSKREFYLSPYIRLLWKEIEDMDNVIMLLSNAELITPMALSTFKLPKELKGKLYFKDREAIKKSDIESIFSMNLKRPLYKLYPISQYRENHTLKIVITLPKSEKVLVVYQTGVTQIVELYEKGKQIDKVMLKMKEMHDFKDDIGYQEDELFDMHKFLRPVAGNTVKIIPNSLRQFYSEFIQDINMNTFQISEYPTYELTPAEKHTISNNFQNLDNLMESLNNVILKKVTKHKADIYINLKGDNKELEIKIPKDKNEWIDLRLIDYLNKEEMQIIFNSNLRDLEIKYGEIKLDLYSNRLGTYLKYIIDNKTLLRVDNIVDKESLLNALSEALQNKFTTIESIKNIIRSNLKDSLLEDLGLTLDRILNKYHRYNLKDWTNDVNKVKTITQYIISLTRVETLSLDIEVNSEDLRIKQYPERIIGKANWK